MQGGETEVVIKDGTRCDCLTDTHAVEVDFGHKWAEGLGQALHYAAMTGKRPGVLLILEGTRSDQAYLDRLKGTSEAWGLVVEVWTVTAVSVHRR